MRPSIPREIEAEWIRHAQPDETAVGQQSEQRVGVRAVRERHVRPEPERVVAVDEVVVVHVDGDRIRRALEARAGRPIQRPAFGAVLAVRRLGPRHDAALAPIEAREVPAARERGPDHTVAVDVDAARRVAVHVDRGIVERRLVDLRDARLGIDPHDASRHRARHRAPDAAVRRVRDHAIEDRLRHLQPREHAARRGQVLERVLVDAGIDPAVAVQVEVRHAPALRLARVAGFLEHACVHPAERAAENPVAVERLVGVVRELNVMSVEADVDLMELLRARIVVLNLPKARLARR